MNVNAHILVHIGSSSLFSYNYCATEWFEIGLLILLMRVTSSHTVFFEETSNKDGHWAILCNLLDEKFIYYLFVSLSFYLISALSLSFGWECVRICSMNSDAKTLEPFQSMGNWKNNNRYFLFLLNFFFSVSTKIYKPDFFTILK